MLKVNEELPARMQKARIQKAFELGEVKLRRTIEHYPDQYPMYTSGGKWVPEGESWTQWCEGFLGGQLWLMYLWNQDPWWRVQAERYTRPLAPRQHDRSVHDLGFLFWPTYKRWYDLTGEAALKQVVIQAGRTLALRFQEPGGYLCSFVGAQSLFIDIMMNVGIIFYAAQQSGDPDLERIAKRHCLTTRRTLVRGDGSTAHEGIFDLESGAFLHESTQQGWRPDSCWARGLAWALYGFGTAFRFSGDPRFLNAAQACAGYYIEHTPAGGVPPNDFDDPDRDTPADSSAAAIAASGLLDLAELTGDLARTALYQRYALNILHTLSGPEYLSSEKPEWEGLLRHAVYHRPRGLGVDESVIWGDYFFLEALSKAAEDANE
jgi:unsaturated chondroitin disaccharide hydrolase